MQTESSSSLSLEQPKETQDHYRIQNIVDNSSLTFAEKIVNIKSLEASSEKSTMISRSGDIVVVNVDLAMAQDSTGPFAIRSLNEMNIERLHDPAKTLLVIDHTFPAAGRDGSGRRLGHAARLEGMGVPLFYRKSDAQRSHSRARGSIKRALPLVRCA